jgi:hypothetical protein
MAYSFDGTDDYIEASSAAVTAAPLTMACWFRPVNTTTNFSLMSLSVNTGATDRFVLQAAGAVAGDPVRLQITQAGTTSNTAVSASGYTANNWWHAAGVFTSSTSRKAYISGVGGTADTTNLTPSGVNRTGIGYHITSGSRTVFTNGRIAEAAIWNEALNDDEIAALANGFRPSLIRPNKLVFYVPLVREVLDVRSALSLTTSGAVVADHTRRIA